MGIREIHLDTLFEESASIAFYDSLGYEEVRREWQAEWALTLVHYRKMLQPGETEHDAWDDKGQG